LKPTVGGTVKGLIMAALVTSISFIDSHRALGFAVFVVGITLFLAAGFAWPEMVHNATHDVRHSFGLPCH
jgi:cobalt transporter subunit CbtB